MVDINEIKKDIIEHKEKYKEYRKRKYKHNKDNSKKFSEQPPECSEKMCRHFFEMASSYINVWNVDYDKKIDMIQFAVERCIRYANNCDVKKDAFAYFTELIKKAFLFYINTENKSDETFNNYKEFIETIYTTSVKGKKTIMI